MGAGTGPPEPPPSFAGNSSPDLELHMSISLNGYVHVRIFAKPRQLGFPSYSLADIAEARQPVFSLCFRVSWYFPGSGISNDAPPRLTTKQQPTFGNGSYIFRGRASNYPQPKGVLREDPRAYSLARHYPESGLCPVAQI